MFISPAYAQAAADGSGSSLLASGIVPMVLVVVVMYFLMIRPQQKKVKEHKAMIDALRRGDRIVTNGGLVGLVTKVVPEEREVQVEIAEGVRVKIVREMIASVTSKTEPVSPKAEDAKT